MRCGSDRPPIKRQAETSVPGVVTLGEKSERFAAARIALLEVS